MILFQYLTYNCLVLRQIRIWDTTNTEHLLKYEYRPLSGMHSYRLDEKPARSLILRGKLQESFNPHIFYAHGCLINYVIWF